MNLAAMTQTQPVYLLQHLWKDFYTERRSAS